MKKSFVLLIVTHLFMLSFCESALCFSPIDVLIAKSNEEDSISKVYPVTRYQAWVIALNVLQRKEANSYEAHYEENYLLAGIGPEDCPCRTEIGVWVERINKNQSKVTIVTKGRAYKNDFTNLRTFPNPIGTDFHKEFEKGVQIISHGGKLPSIPP